MRVKENSINVKVGISLFYNDFQKENRNKTQNSYPQISRDKKGLENQNVLFLNNLRKSLLICG
jgi:hypothetical protein